MRRRTFLAFLALTFSLFALPAHATGPYLVKDIDPAGTGVGSDPSLFTTLEGGVSLWVAQNGEHGRELWRTDGTDAGTYLVLDGGPGVHFPRLSFLGNSGDRAFFVVQPEDSFTSELWVTGGTPGDTSRLAGALAPSTAPALWVPGQGVLYFAANDGKTGQELWRSDGTPSGTYQLADLRPGSQGSNPDGLTAFHGRVFFRANDGTHGAALWSTDGTEAGTRLVHASPSGAPAFDPTGLTALGSRLVFFGVTAATGRELWVSDGSGAGTRLLGDFIPGATGMVVLALTVAGGRLWFVAADPARGQELWVTNGTSAGTRRLTDFPNPGAFSKDLLGFRPFWVGGRLVFPIDDSVHGYELWATDGTTAGTGLLRDLNPGAGGSLLFPMQMLNGRLYFAAFQPARGVEPWSTNGTAAGTRLVADVCPGACSSFAFGFQLLGGQLFFGADDGIHGYEIWRAEGGGEAVRVSDLEKPLEFFAVPGRDSLVFVQSDEATGRELWRTDGTAGGTRLLRDINRTIAGGSQPDHLQDAGGRLWFDTARPERALWTSDGTAAWTFEVHAFGDDESLEDIGFVASRGLVFFEVETGAGISVWRTDGTAEGTFRVSPEGLRIPALQPLAAAGGNVYFAAGEDAGNALWKTDGTAAGTVEVFQSEDLSGPQGLTTFAGRVFFSAETGLRRTLWSSDGTAAGTSEVADVDLDSVQILGIHAGRLWFLARTEEHGTEVWSTDGTAAGTSLLGDVAPGDLSFLPHRMVSAGALMFFSVVDGSTGLGLWVSDGTLQGTRRIGPTAILGDKRGFAVLGSRLFYHSFNDGKLWVSDGTAAGTRPLADFSHGSSGLQLAPFAGRMYFTDGIDLWQTDGTTSGTVRVTLPDSTRLANDPAVSAGRLFFQATDLTHGTELWALE